MDRKCPEAGSSASNFLPEGVSVRGILEDPIKAKGVYPFNTSRLPEKKTGNLPIFEGIKAKALNSFDLCGIAYENGPTCDFRFSFEDRGDAESRKCEDRKSKA